MRRFFFTAAPLEAADTLSTAVADEAPHQARLAALDAAIAALPAALKEPLLLTVFEEMSQAEAAELLGVSAKAVAEAFLSAHPKSPLRSRIEAACKR